jgi:MoaA/NifB/PqqE/SkfB family radical SAM enzyme
MAFEPIGDLADTALMLRALSQMATCGVQGVVWSGGGEPTLHPDWPEIVARAVKVGLQQGMYTLGGHFTPETARTLARVAAWVVVSLDACDAETYATEKGVLPARFFDACQGIQWLAAEKGAAVGVSFLLHAENWHRAPEMLAFARALGATYTTFRPTIETLIESPSICASDREWISVCEPILRTLAKAPDVECDVDRFLAYRDWSGRSYAACHGIKLNATITPDGRVWVCPQRRGVAGSAIGDLRVESFADLWARHPGQWTDFEQCRAMCRLHLINETLDAVYRPYAHEAFV